MNLPPQSQTCSVSTQNATESQCGIMTVVETTSTKSRPETRPCSKCGTVKPITEFYVCAGCRRHECKSCTIDYVTEWKQRNHYYQNTKNSPKRIAYRLKYYQDNKEKILKYSREWRKKHLEYFKEYYRKYRASKNKSGSTSCGPTNQKKTLTRSTKQE